MFGKRGDNPNNDEGGRRHLFRRKNKNQPQFTESTDVATHPSSSNLGVDASSHNAAATIDYLLEQSLSPHVAQNTNHSTPVSASNMAWSASLPAWPGLQSLQYALNEAVGPLEPLKSAISKLAWCMQNESTAGRDYRNIISVLDELLQDLSTYFGSSTPPSMTPVIETLALDIKKEAERVTEAQQRYKMSRLAQASKELDEIEACYRRIQGILARLKLNADLGIWRTVDEHLADKRLDRLPYSPSASYDSASSASLRRTSCTEDTRVDLLQKLWDWATDPTSEKVFWLNGMAGTGKTTVAYTLCKRLKADQKLAASFFCSQRLPECRDVNRIISTICYQLSLFSRPFRCAVSQVLGQHPEAHNQLLSQQFDNLLVKPIIGVHSAIDVRSALPTNLVVVIDALDECDNKETIGDMICVLLQHARDVPIKFFIASRPDVKILDRIREQSREHISTELRLHELDRSIVQADIRTYLIANLRPRMELSTTVLNALVQQCDLLFIYAATIVQFIANDNFSRGESRLKEVLSVYNDSSRGSDRDLDALYTAILRMALNDLSLTEPERTEMSLILHTVVCAEEPLSINVMAALLSLEDEMSVFAALRPLFSVLQVSDDTQVITTLHKSFSDYLFDKSRSGSFFCDKKAHSAHLARLCFEHIKIPNPPFNICGLESSYAFDQELPELSLKIQNAISEELFYSCRHWGAHLRQAILSEELAGMMFDFLSERLLLWMEVMNLKMDMPYGNESLYNTYKWSLSALAVTESQKLLKDAWIFAKSFSESFAVHSTPHIYVSTLSFWPRHRPIAICYQQKQPWIVPGVLPDPILDAISDPLTYIRQSRPRHLTTTLYTGTNYLDTIPYCSPYLTGSSRWLIIDDTKPVVWVPIYPSDVIICPQKAIITSKKHRFLQIRFNRDNIGEHWAEHFRPVKPLRT